MAHVSLNIIRAEKQPSCNGHFKNISSKATAIAVQLVATKPIFYNHYLVLCKLTVNAFVTIMEKILTFQQIWQAAVTIAKAQFKPTNNNSTQILSWRTSRDQSQYSSTYTVSQKKQDTKLLPITSPNVNRFSKFFHW